MAHWYTTTGEAKHWVDKADGGTRDTTLADARKLNLVPSVTTIIDSLAKPGLERAAQTLLIEWCADNPYKGMNVDLYGYAKFAKEEAFEQWTEARIIGGEIHNDIEHIFKDDMPEYGLKHAEISHAAVGIIQKYCGTLDDFTTEQTVAGDGYGGMVDLYNHNFLVDHKTKDITDKQWDLYEAGKNPRIVYPGMAMQLAAYDEALGSNTRRCINFFIDRKIPERVIIHEWHDEEIETAFKQFQCLVTFWQLKTGHYPK